MIVGGGGGVGASVAFNLLIGGGEFDVVLTDRRPEMARSHVLDLEQVLEQQAAGCRKAADYVREAAASAAVDVTGLAAGDDADR